MQHYWDTWETDSSRTFGYPSPWQDWGHMRNQGNQFLISDTTLSTTKSPKAKDGWNAPSSDANNVLTSIKIGEPIAVSTYATGGHVMVLRGGVVDYADNVKWLIFNDPYGTLAGQDSIYDQSLDIAHPVGARGNLDTSASATLNHPDDVIAVQDILRYFGHYNGAIHGICDGENELDETVQAIKAFQISLGWTNPDGRVDPNSGTENRINEELTKRHTKYFSYRDEENERNESNTNTDDSAERGKHVYYNSDTEGKGYNNSKHFEIKESALSFRITKTTSLTKKQIAEHLVKGN
jgi:peptidoglycan hydrolase-like protein with peptidoglycan-binding domain